MFADQTPPSPSPERLGLLAARPVLRGLDAHVLSEIDAALESVHVPGGTRIVERGQTDVPLILVVQGGLRASYADENGRRHTVFERFRGGTVGEALVLGGQPSPLDLDAIRDSHLLCLSRDRFGDLAHRYPELALAFAREVTTHLVELMDSPEALTLFSANADRLPRSVAVLSVGGERVQRTRDLLVDALSRACPTARVGAREARAAVGAEERPDIDGFSGRLVGWLESLSVHSDLLVFDCDPSDASWLDVSLRHADRIVVLLEEDAEGWPPGGEPRWWREVRPGGRHAHLELAIVRRPGAGLRHPGEAYARLPGVTRLHHVHGASAQDARRLARWLLDRPVGLVLSGGGAYGIAHVGVFKALEEAGVPVDTVGGTSMGAIFAGGIAMQWSADEIMEEVRSLFGPRLALYDPTIPVRALLAGKKLDGVMARLFQDFSIADLMIPFFCVATNISRARPEVLDSGAMGHAIRSSCSIPGLFPPVRSDGRVLVDGGLMNNLPFGVMRERCPGPIVAVNVFPYRHDDEQKKNAAGHDGQTSPRPRADPLDLMRDRMRSKLKLVGVPVFDTLVRASFVGSQHADEASLSAHPPALYLAPEVTKLRILDWRSYDAFFQIGYECAKRALDAGTLPRSLWEGPLVKESTSNGTTRQ